MFFDGGQLFEAIADRIFSPMPKFLCVKGILFFSFWQSIFISILVAAGAITQLGPYTDNEHISTGLTDTLICFEMPIFAIAHMYAFSQKDYIDRKVMYAARMPMYYALRDAFGLRDVIEDTKATLRGEGMDYREFEPAEGFIHQGSGRDRRIKAGLRYSKGGQGKYWLPMPADVAETRRNPVNKATGREDDDEEVYAPLLEGQAEHILHEAPSMRDAAHEKALAARRGFDLPFGDPSEDEDADYTQSRHYLFGDYHYPCIDASSEIARREMWDEEERVLRDERGAYFSPIRGSVGLLASTSGNGERGYGAIRPPAMASRSPSFRPLADANASGKGKAREGDGLAPVSNHVESVIDKEDDATPAPIDGVRLKWTKQLDVRPRTPRSSSSSPRQQQPPPDPRSGASSTAKDTASPHAHLAQHDLPSDAVDLIVENAQLGQEEMTKEMTKGEPAVRGSGLRKVYTRGYDVPAEPTAAHGVWDERPRYSPPQRMSPSESVETVEATIEDADTEVARAATPPPHARAAFGHPGLHIDEDNPWA